MKKENTHNSDPTQGMEESSTKVEQNSKPCCCGGSKSGFCDGSHLKIPKTPVNLIEVFEPGKPGRILTENEARKEYPWFFIETICNNKNEDI